MLVFLFHDTTCDDLDRLNEHIDRLSDLATISHVTLNTHSPDFSVECYDNVTRHTYKGAEALSLYITFRKIEAAVRKRPDANYTDFEQLAAYSEAMA